LIICVERIYDRAFLKNIYTRYATTRKIISCMANIVTTHMILITKIARIRAMTAIIMSLSFILI